MTSRFAKVFLPRAHAQENEGFGVLITNDVFLDVRQADDTGTVRFGTAGSLPRYVAEADSPVIGYWGDGEAIPLRGYYWDAESEMPQRAHPVIVHQDPSTPLTIDTQLAVDFSTNPAAAKVKIIGDASRPDSGVDYLHPVTTVIEQNNERHRFVVGYYLKSHLENSRWTFIPEVGGVLAEWDLEIPIYVDGGVRYFSIGHTSGRIVAGNAQSIAFIPDGVIRDVSAGDFLAADTRSMTVGRSAFDNALTSAYQGKTSVTDVETGGIKVFLDGSSSSGPGPVTTPLSIRVEEPQTPDLATQPPVPTTIPTTVPEEEEFVIPEIEGFYVVSHGSGSTTLPTTIPTTLPTTIPTTLPTTIPTTLPTTIPTTLPTTIPTTLPTTIPTTLPTTIPTTLPTTIPTTLPTTIPTTLPTTIPTTLPTTIPTTLPTTIPTTLPTTIPTTLPTTIPTTLPTTIPTTLPTTIPTTLPTTIPTTLPTTIPTTLPTTIPTTLPTTIPTTLPTTIPTTLPTTIPTTLPTTPTTPFLTTTPTTTPFPTTTPTTTPFPTTTPTTTRGPESIANPTTPTTTPTPTTTAPTTTPTTTPTPTTTAPTTPTPTTTPTTPPTTLPVLESIVTPTTTLMAVVPGALPFSNAVGAQAGIGANVKQTLSSRLSDFRNRNRKSRDASGRIRYMSKSR